jgi:hypothetical protein
VGYLASLAMPASEPAQNAAPGAGR